MEILEMVHKLSVSLSFQLLKKFKLNNQHSAVCQKLLEVIGALCITS